jgi:hypothetical protein
MQRGSDTNTHLESFEDGEGDEEARQCEEAIDAELCGGYDLAADASVRHDTQAVNSSFQPKGRRTDETTVEIAIQ